MTITTAEFVAGLEACAAELDKAAARRRCENEHHTHHRTAETDQVLRDLSARRLDAQGRSDQYAALGAVAAAWAETVRIERLAWPEMLLAPESNEAMDARDARLLAYQAEQNAREAGCSQEQIDHYAGRELGVS